jgi:hypothetical protein
MAMNDYTLLMHNDAPVDPDDRPEQWPACFAKLGAANAFQGGSAIGDGICLSKRASAPEITRHLAGYIRIQAESLSAARELVIGNPVFEAGGTVEVRELPRD